MMILKTMKDFKNNNSQSNDDILSRKVYDQRFFITLLVISQFTFLQLFFMVYRQKVHLAKTEHNSDRHYVHK